MTSAEQKITQPLETSSAIKKKKAAANGGNREYSRMICQR
jgi:hypothetical protein